MPATVQGSAAFHQVLQYRLDTPQIRQPALNIRKLALAQCPRRAAVRAVFQLEQFANFIEAAETKALGRALAALGFGTQFAGDLGTDRNGFGLSDAPVRLHAVGESSTQQYQSAYQQTELEPTDRQRKLIEVLRSQLNLGIEELDEIAQQHGGAPMESIGRKGVSALITELQRLKQEKQERAKAS